MRKPKSKILFKPLKGQRKGQSVFNFLAWLRTERYVEEGESYRMADPFYLPDKEWDLYWKEFKEENED